ncbi:MAG: IS1182 family transposase [Syntrophobacteraceae bacterium]
MEKTFKSCDRKQMLLLPPSLLDWLPEGHLAHFILDVVEQLDLSKIYASYKGDGRGQPPYEPGMMTALLFYAYCTGVPSSRQIEKRTHEDIAFRVIAANRHPDHDSICEFRKRHLKALAGLFVQILRLCQQAGLVKLGHVALDGTKIKANASKHKAMSYGNMKKKKEELEKEIDELLKNAEAVDKEEDKKYGKGKKGWDLPDELKRRETRLEKIKEAMSALEEEAEQQAAEKQKAKEAQKKSKNASASQSPPVVLPSDKAQRNFTDPDSRIMKVSSTNSFEQCYNGQAIVDDSSQVIVAAGLSQHANDVEEVEPILDILEENLGGIPHHTAITTDAGYFSETNLMLFEDALLNPFMATQKMKHGEVLPQVRGRIPQDMTPKDRMRRKLCTKKGQEIYSKRKSTVEPVFGQIKQARGLRQFLLRGYENVSAEWQMWCLSHNLLKMYRHGGPF